jgi:hypothetical protein
MQDGIDGDRVILRRNLRLYIRKAWPVVEPSTIYLENWHIDLIADYLTAVTEGQIKRLLINMPSRYAKSTSVSIMWPTWVWARDQLRIGRTIRRSRDRARSGYSRRTPMKSAPSTASTGASCCRANGIGRVGGKGASSAGSNGEAARSRRASTTSN